MHGKRRCDKPKICNPLPLLHMFDLSFQQEEGEFFHDDLELCKVSGGLEPNHLFNDTGPDGNSLSYSAFDEKQIHPSSFPLQSGFGKIFL